MYVYHTVEACSHNRGCSVKINMYYVFRACICRFVALVIQRTVHLRHVVISGLYSPIITTTTTPSHKQHDFQEKSY